MIKLLQYSLRTWNLFSFSDSHFLFVCIILSGCFFICHFSSQSFSSLFKILHSHKSQSSTHDTYLLSSSLSPILSPCWNLLRCNCHYEWWSVSVRVCLIAHLYTHIFFPTQTQIHTHTHTSSDMYYVMCAHRICTHRYIYRHTHFYAHLCDK